MCSSASWILNSTVICTRSGWFLELAQPGLIQKIISACRLEQESNEHKTPATSLFHADSSSPECKHNWNYWASIGMLAYLSTSIRPSIAFAVHQCAHFSANPKRVHEVAVCRIVRYSKGTKDKGYIHCPSTTSWNLDCFVVVGFSGLWRLENSYRPISVKSRTGYVITFTSCPILWSSKLQSEVAEYCWGWIHSHVSGNSWPLNNVESTSRFLESYQVDFWQYYHTFYHIHKW